MNDFVAHLPHGLVRATLLIAVSAVVVHWLLLLVRPYQVWLHRTAWGIVLCQGLLVAQLTWEVPWYDTRPDSPAPSDSPWPAALPSDIRFDARGDQLPGNLPRASVQQPARGPSRSGGWSLPQLLVLAWLVGMFIWLLLTTISYIRFLMGLRQTRPARADWQEQWQALLAEHAVQRRIPLLVHDRCGPMLCRSPGGYQVVVPEDLWGTFSRPQRLSILRHELAHYQRGDIWKSLVARLIAAPHWFNPFAWWAVRKLDETSEWACDDSIAAMDHRQLPDFARALLRVVQPKAIHIGTTAARGAPLSTRLRRLLILHRPEDSLMKRCFLLGALICMGIAGLVRFHLVAKEPSKTQPVAASKDLELRIVDFTAQLASDSSALVKRFREAIATRAGQIVLQDRIAHREAELQRTMQAEAVPTFVEQHFSKEGDRVQLRPGQDELRARILNLADTFNGDVEQMGKATRAIASNMSQDSELDRLVARFLSHDAAPVMLYVEQLRERIRPDERLIERLLGKVFVRNEDGQYTIRAARRPDAEQFSENANRILKGVNYLQTELSLLSDELAATDELHQQMKQAMSESAFAALIAAEMIPQEGQVSAERRIERFFEQLDNITRDTADGLTIVEDEQPEVRALLNRYHELRASIEQLEQPLRAFTQRISKSDELHRSWRALLQTDVAYMKLADEYGTAALDPADAVHALLGEVIQKGDDGQYRVSADKSEQVADAVQTGFRRFRQARRRGRLVDELADQLHDPELQSALKSMGGKFAVSQMIQSKLAEQGVDGLAVWIDEHFRQTADGLRLKNEAHAELEEFLQQVAEVNAELSKNDF